MRGRILSIGLILATFGFACDRQPAIPDVEPEHPATQPAKPTTQQLLDGPWKRTQLSYIPFSVEIPAGWEVKTFDVAGEVIAFLEGPAPRDDVKIQLSNRPVTSKERLQYIEEGAAKEKAENSRIKVDEFKTMGTVRVRDRQVVGQATSFPVLNENGLPLTDTSPNYRWTVTLYVANGENDYRAYEMNFIGLTSNQFDVDKTFLRKLLDSLKLEETPKADAPPTTKP